MLARGAVIIRKDNMIGLEFNIKNHFKTFYRLTDIIYCRRFSHEINVKELLKTKVNFCVLN